MAEWNGTELDGLVLHSGRLTLRAWQPADIAAVEQIMLDPAMAEYLSMATRYPSEVAARLVTEWGPAGRADGSQLDCAIAENTTGQLVGSISLVLPRHARPTAEIGYWLGSAFRGRGYVGEALQTVTRFGFGNGLGRIEIRCAPANSESAAVALQAGYAFEGISRASRPTPAGPADEAVFARVASDSGDPIKPPWTPPAELSDGVVSLRLMRPTDWPMVLAEALDPDSQRWGFGGDPMTEAAAIAQSAGARLDWLVGRQVRLVICDAATGAAAGTMNLRSSGPPEVVGIGYGVLPEFRGRRFTSRALTLLSDWAFTDTPIARLELGCKRDNIASARSAEAAGFVADGYFTGRLRNPDSGYSDEIGYGKVRPTA